MNLLDEGASMAPDLDGFRAARRNLFMAVRKTDESDRLFVIEVGMENRAPEEIAKDAAFQISGLFDRLIEEQQKKDDQDIV